MYLDNPMSVAYEAAKAAHFGVASAGQQHPGHRRIDHRADGRPDARVLRAAVQPGQHRAGVRRQGGVGVRWSSSPTRIAAPGRASRPADVAGPVHGTGSFQAILRADDQQQTVVGVVRRASPGEPRPLRGPPAGDHPGRPHRLAALLGADRSRPGRRRRAFLPGLQPGRRVLLLPELRARRRPRPTSIGSPRFTATRCAKG